MISQYFFYICTTHKNTEKIMKPFLTLVTFLFFTCNVVWGAVRTTETIMIGDTTRTFLRYVPDNYNSSNPVKLLVLLHGFNGTMSYFEENGYNPGNMADEQNAIIVSLQALDEKDATVASFITTLHNAGFIPFGTNGAWGAGVSSPVNNTIITDPQQWFLVTQLYSTIASEGKAVLNKKVDDVNFINQVISKIKTNYTVDNSKVYMFGFSMGGAMAYKYAFSANPQIMAMAIESGFIGNEVNTSGNFPISTYHFHSTDDEIVKFNGTLFNDSIQNIINLLAAKNNHDAPTETAISNSTEEDNMTVTTYDYTKSGEPRLLFYKITGAEHDLAGIKDINIGTEMWRFFNGEPLSNGIDETFESQLTFYPNPAKENIVVSATGDYAIYNLNGELLLSGKIEKGNDISVKKLSKGNYIIIVNSDSENLQSILTIQ